jgi:pseudouridine kinase
MRFASVHCIGGCVIDRSGETAERQARLHTSNIGTLVRSHGGAARNVAENLARLGVPVSLSTVVGGDEDGREALAATEAAGVDVSRCVVLEGRRTASYTAIFGGDGELVIGLADMAIFEELGDRIAPAEPEGAGAGTLLFLDANLPERTLAALLSACRGPAAVSPVSVQKSRRVRDHLELIDMLFLNVYEAAALLAATPEAEVLAAALVASPVPRGVLTDGPGGALAWDSGRVEHIAAASARPVNVNGAGDALAAGTMARLWAGDDFVEAVRFGVALAAMTVEEAGSVAATATMDSVLARGETLARPAIPAPGRREDRK